MLVLCLASFLIFSEYISSLLDYLNEVDIIFGYGNFIFQWYFPCSKIISSTFQLNEFTLKLNLFDISATFIPSCIIIIKNKILNINYNISVNTIIKIKDLKE